MTKSVLSLLSVMLFLHGCTTLKPASPICPPPPQLPALDKVPQELLEQSFLQGLEKRMFEKPSGPMSSDYTLRPATPSTSGLKAPSKASNP